MTTYYVSDASRSCPYDKFLFPQVIVTENQRQNTMTKNNPEVHTVFENKTSTWQYIVADPDTRDAVIIDSVLDYDPSTNTISTSSADRLLLIVESNSYNVVAILETHAHADHLTAANYLQNTLLRQGKSKADICIGKRIEQVQRNVAHKYSIDSSEYVGIFDRYLDDDETFAIGKLEAKVVHLPGHTPDHVGYIIGPNVFTGDSIFLPDVGSARCDFPGGDAKALYSSMSKLFELPSDYRLYSGHDYPPGDRQGPQAYSTVGEQKATNKHVGGNAPESNFVKWRTERDSGLAEPKLIHQALQFNVRAGRLPKATSAGDRFLHVPLKVPEALL
ncbi:metallo-beta-lactamase superfamily protein [Whalleya microplaca]|nr:metallo-beta-lactamase superfamily protein [Whalleya microplaca]